MVCINIISYFSKNCNSSLFKYQFFPSCYTRTNIHRYFQLNFQTFYIFMLKSIRLPYPHDKIFFLILEIAYSEVYRIHLGVVDSGFWWCLLWMSFFFAMAVAY